MINVFLICSGLGHTQRGFESFSQECFAALSNRPELDITLFKGGGVSRDREIRVWNLPRQGWLAKFFGQILKRNAYYVEQVTFFVGLLPYLIKQKPELVYFSDGIIGNCLWHWRNLTRQSYKLLLSNGGPLSPPFDRWDLVQQVSPIHLQNALQYGEPLNKQALVPYGIHITSDFKTISELDRKNLRKRIGLPDSRPILLSVGAINKSHKRMDYVIREVAQLPEPRPYLLLLGQQDQESVEIACLGMQLLGSDNFQIKTVAQEEIDIYYRVANIFILASLGEGFGRVFLEAMKHGLPCLAHDYEVTQYVLGKEGYLANLQVSGNLANLISTVLAKGDTEHYRCMRQQSVYERFSWDELCSAYVEMIQSPVKIHKS